jgi:hypothetical protein
MHSESICLKFPKSPGQITQQERLIHSRLSVTAQLRRNRTQNHEAGNDDISVMACERLDRTDRVRLVAGLGIQSVASSFTSTAQPSPSTLSKKITFPFHFPSQLCFRESTRVPASSLVRPCRRCRLRPAALWSASGGCARVVKHPKCRGAASPPPSHPPR